MLTLNVFILGTLAVFIMYTAVKASQRSSRDAQGKMCGLMIVIGFVGLFLIYSTHDKIADTIFTHNQALTWSTEEELSDKQINVDAIDTQDPELKTPEVRTEPAVNKTFGIVFDAGSTGTRIHVFKLNGGNRGKPYEMEDELFKDVKPGLSAYANDPKKGAESLIEMLEAAKTYIPQSQWSDTAISLKATAGLRLLPSTQSQAILSEVEAIIRKYPFKTSGKFVDIMDGTDEGVFSWFTVNFFKGTIGNEQTTVGVMDLGGGSTQITFVPTQEATMKSSPSDYFTTVQMTGDNTKLYTHSYLGLGLMSGRLQTLGGKEGLADNPSVLSSPCFPSDFSTAWTHGGRNYTLKGIEATEGHAKECYSKAKTVVDSYKVHQPAETSSTHFVLISYYYDRATEAGLMDDENFMFCEQPDKLEPCDNKAKGGEIKISDFISAAGSACDNFNRATPFMCLDLSYIHALLQDGFGFKPDTDITVLKRINDREISWGLGAMFQMLNNQKAAPAAR